MPYKDIEDRREYLRLWHKVHCELEGICRRCYRSVFPGLTLCLYHLEENKRNKKRYYQKHGGYIRAKAMERSNRLMQEGKCRTCGIELIEGEGQYCINCRIVQDYYSIKGVFYEVNTTSST